MNSAHLSTSDLENFDPRSPNRGKERRFCCPLCGQGKPIDAPHRCLAVNTENGSFYCHRCQAKGRLKDFWDDTRLITPKKQKTRQKLNSHFSINATAAKPQNELPESISEKMIKYQSQFLHSNAEMYLLNRGIGTDIAMNAGCGFADNWEHWEKDGEKWKLLGTDKRVVFPIYDQNGNLIATHGRAIDEDHFGSPKITRGDKSNGVFLSDAQALSRPIVAICEGAIDAMALAMSGICAVAMTGTTPPDWLYRKLAFKNVLIATDADEAGDKSAYKLRFELHARGAKTFRLRPRNAKDWGEVLENIGVIEMQRFMSIFSEIPDSERYTEAIRLNEAGRGEVATFIANLIIDLNLRARLLFELRTEQQKKAA